MSRKKPELTVVASDETAPAQTQLDGESSRDIGDVHYKKPQQYIGNFQVPHAYEVWGDGLYAVLAPSPDDPALPGLKETPSSMRRANLKLVCHEPLWIQRFGTVLDSGEQLAELAFKDAFTDDVRALWVGRDQIASKIAITKLAARGVPITEANCLAVMHYLDAALHMNGGRLEIVNVLTRTGAHTLPNGIGWLVGQRWIGPHDTQVAPDPRGATDLNPGFTVSGLEEEWFQKFRQIASVGPHARWLIYSSFAPPLLRLVDQRTFVVHHWGPSGSGKTALAKFAQSAWGDPNILTMSFNRTEKSFVETFSHVDDVPVLFDELQSSNKDDILKILYLLCLEQGRGRATTAGGLQRRISGWHTVVRMTGEEPVIGRDGQVDLGGVTNRTIQIGTSVLSSHAALDLHQWLGRRHFGWGAMRFLGRLAEVMALPDGQGQQLIVERFQALQEAVRRRLASLPTQHARLSQLTVVALAEYLANRWFFGADPELAFEGAVSDAVAVATTLADEEQQMPVAEQALQLFRDHYVAHRHLWFDLNNEAEADVIRANKHRQLFGVVSEVEVWLVQHEANTLLRKAGYPPRRVWSDLRASGALVLPPSAKGTFATPRRHGQFYSKVYVILSDHLIGA